MRSIEQRKMIQELRDYVSRMDRREREEFEMLQKRDKDDEELDQLSFSRLEVMHKCYVVKKTRADIEALFKRNIQKQTNGEGEQ